MALNMTWRSAAAVGLAAMASASAVRAQECGGLVGRWSFEETGSAVADGSGAGNHGVAFGGPARIAGVSGQALGLDGVDDFVEVADSPSLNPSSAMSISAWWYAVPFRGSGSDPVVDKGAACHCDPYYQYHIGVSGSQYPQSARSIGFTATANGVSSSAGTTGGAFQDGQWVHAVGAYDGTTVKFYLNGELRVTQPMTGPITSYGNALRFGRFTNLGQFYLPGAIDEIRIYDRALDDSEAALLHDSPSGRPMIFPPTATVCAGGTATFAVRHVGGASATFAWYRDGALIAGETDASIAVSSSESAAFTCVVTSGCGVEESLPATVTVCGADFNCDGFLDFFDYDDFVLSYETGGGPGGLGADYNGDGFVDFFDYDDFVQAFETGC